MNLLCVGASYRNADVATLERLAITPGGLPQMLQRLVGQPYVGAAVLLSTCNRVEVYAAVTGLHRGAVVVHVEVLGELGGGQAGLLGQHGADVAETAVEPADRGVHLDAVAGGEHDGLADVGLGDEAAEDGRDVRLRHGEALQRADRGGPVRGADDEEVHDPTAS